MATLFLRRLCIVRLSSPPICSFSRLTDRAHRLSKLAPVSHDVAPPHNNDHAPGTDSSSPEHDFHESHHPDPPEHHDTHHAPSSNSGSHVVAETKSRLRPSSSHQATNEPEPSSLNSKGAAESPAATATPGATTTPTEATTPQQHDEAPSTPVHEPPATAKPTTQAKSAAQGASLSPKNLFLRFQGDPASALAFVAFGFVGNSSMIILHDILDSHTTMAAPMTAAAVNTVFLVVAAKCVHFLTPEILSKFRNTRSWFAALLGALLGCFPLLWPEDSRLWDSRKRKNRPISFWESTAASASKMKKDFFG